ncbi:3D domain-containing protein [Alkalihalobacillus oceani]|uniref:3D domain-containing protein n=1 Tax=Halalkalibacter oceani TaxID=1653776 RepID=A0A9X2IPN4_9BACI|nr:G5 and 3D domain-containing protein [Halalkalibacter oceani]MCM3715430.1 3D domain-containing protein [Halalkalibacter oceani]
MRKVVSILACMAVGISIVMILIFLIPSQSIKHIVLDFKGKSATIQTKATVIEELLSELEIEMSPSMTVYPDQHTKLTHGMLISIKQRVPVTINYNGEKILLQTDRSTVEEVIREELGIVPTLHDYLYPAASDPIQEGSNIIFQTAFQVSIQQNGTQIKRWTTPGTVRDILQKHNIIVGEDEFVRPSLDTRLTTENTIEIIEFLSDKEVQTEYINYSVIKQESDDLMVGQEQIIQEGQQGIIEKTFHVIEQDGKETSRILVSEEVTREPSNQLIAVGTKKQVERQNPSIQDHLPSIDRVPPLIIDREGKETMLVTATAYTPDCLGCTGITKMGIDLRHRPNIKVIAVDPEVIPLGATVYVEGYGKAVASDIGSAIKGKKIDLYMHTEEEALRWGRRQVQVTLLDS